MSSVDTLLFVDIDGVLNVSIGDESGPPLDLTPGNIAHARKMRRHPDRCKERDRICVDRVLATCARKLGQGETSTYEQLITDASIGVSNILVERLAVLIRRIQGHGAVILSSFWRLPKFASRLAKLEAAISEKLGSCFQFDGKTRAMHDNTPGLRLQAIGDFVAERFADHGDTSELRILVLDDFFGRPVDQWACADTMIDSVASIEKYLEKRVPSSRVTARVIHTIDSFTGANGSCVRIGSGLTQEHFSRAQNFLDSQSLRSRSKASTTCVPMEHRIQDHEAFFPDAPHLFITDVCHDSEQSIKRHPLPHEQCSCHFDEYQWENWEKQSGEPDIC